MDLAHDGLLKATAINNLVIENSRLNFYIEGREVTKCDDIQNSNTTIIRSIFQIQYYNKNGEKETDVEKKMEIYLIKCEFGKTICPLVQVFQRDIRFSFYDCRVVYLQM